MATELRSVPVNAANALLDRRLHDIGWGLLLMLTGMIWQVPAERVPEGAWLLGVAAILLGVNVVRVGVPLSGPGGERLLPVQVDHRAHVVLIARVQRSRSCLAREGRPGHPMAGFPRSTRQTRARMAGRTGTSRHGRVGCAPARVPRRERAMDSSAVWPEVDLDYALDGVASTLGLPGDDPRAVKRAVDGPPLDTVAEIVQCGEPNLTG